MPRTARFGLGGPRTSLTASSPIQRRSSYEVARDQLLESAKRLKALVRTIEHANVSGITIILRGDKEEVLFLP
jgi:hypothetical protein